MHPAVVRPRVPSEGRRHQRCTESKGPEELVVVIANPGTLKPGKDGKANPNTSGITTRAVELGEKFYMARGRCDWNSRVSCPRNRGC